MAYIGGMGMRGRTRMSEDGDLATLIARCALRDRHAFARLYQNSAARLYAVALRIVRRHDWAEEILQESFISIWNHITEYSAQKSAPMTWMTAIVRNRALDWLRRPDVERGSEDYDVLVQTIPDQAFGPENACKPIAPHAPCSNAWKRSARSSAEPDPRLCARLVTCRAGCASARAVGDSQDLGATRSGTPARLPGNKGGESIS